MNNCFFRFVKQLGWLAIVGGLIALAGCGGDGGGSDSPASVSTPAANSPPAVLGVSFTAPKSLTLATYSGSSTSPDRVVTNSAGDRIEFWTGLNSSGVIVPVQARLTLRASGDSYRVVYNSTTGVPERFINEKTGDFVVQAPADNALVVQVHRADGTFAGGYRVTQAGGRVSVAPIQGRAFFSGQLALQLNGGTRPASAVLIPAADTVAGTATELPRNVQTFLNGGTPVTLRTLPVNRLLDFLMSSAHAQQGSVQQFLSGVAQFVAGTGLAVGGYYAPTLLPALFSPLVAPIAVPIIAGGLVIAAGWNYSNGVEDIIGGGIRMVADTMNRFADGSTPADIASQQASLILSSGALTSASRTLNKVLGNATDTLSSLVSTANLVVPGLIPAVTTTVTGASVDASGVNVPMTGTVSSTGVVTASNSAGINTLNVNATVTGQGTANGNFSGYLGNGTSTGSTSELGKCQQITSSGGQGTFVRAHNLGATTGVSVFSYDAYRIPDQFTVSTGGATVFGTNKLVSGAASANVLLNGTGIVFVAVNAPNSGTQWEYQLSCP